MSISTALIFCLFTNPVHADESPPETLNLQGKWLLDIKASLDRCFRLEMSDCKGKDRAVVEKKMQAGLTKIGTISFEFDNQKVTGTFGDRVDQSTYTEAHKGFTYTVIAIKKEEGPPDTLIFLQEEPNVICMGENFSGSDTFCFRKTP